MGDNTNEIEFVKFIDRLNLSIVEFGEDKIEVWKIIKNTNFLIET